MVNMKEKGWFILLGWIGYVIFWFFNAESISETIANSNMFIGILLYFLGNPAYLILIWITYKFGKTKGRAVWKRILSPILFVLALDFVTLPRLAPTDALTNGIATTTNIGSIVMRGLVEFMPHSTAYFTFYVILAIAFFYISMELIGVTNFVKENFHKK